MVLKFTHLLLSALVFTTTIAQTNICHATEIVNINGSGNALDMMKPLVEAYSKNNRDVSIQIGKPLGSSGAVKALMAGALDIAVISSGLKTAEAAKGVQLRKYGKTPLAIVVGKSACASNITTKELEDIFAGKINTWQNNDKIRLVLRPQEDTDTRILRTLSTGLSNAITTAHTRPGMIIAITDPESYSTISRTPGSLGATGMNSIISEKLHLTMLSLNSIKPSIKTLANGTYPLAKEISFATTSKTKQSAQKLIGFIFSQHGRAIAEKNGVFITAGPAGGH